MGWQWELPTQKCNLFTQQRSTSGSVCVSFLFHQLLQIAVGLLDALAEHLGIELGTEERGMCVVALVVLGGLLLAACLFDMQLYQAVELALGGGLHEFIGGDIILTIPYGWQKKYDSSNVEIKDNMSRDVDPAILNELLTLEEFRKAYDENFPQEQFQYYGAFKATINQFLNGYDGLLQLLRKYMVK